VGRKTSGRRKGYACYEARSIVGRDLEIARELSALATELDDAPLRTVWPSSL
jgi:hypothetical protein